MRRVGFEAARDGAVAEWHRLADVIDGADLTAATRLPGWTMAELVAHLTATVRAVSRYLEKPAPAKPETDLLGYLGVTASVADAVAGRAREQAAGRSASELREAFRATVDEAETALQHADPDRNVVARLGALPLADFLVTRCVEAVVHGLDLGAGEPDATALKIVVCTLADLLAAKAPGRSVEVRIPGPSGTAVQCGEGPPHKRGTPPNVVETDPVTFVELTTGRLTWADAVQASRVHASGSRADLSPYLPVMV